MTCVHCGMELPDDAIYCLRCGQPQRVDPKRVRDQQKRRAWLRGIIVALVIILLLCVGSILWTVPVRFEGDVETSRTPVVNRGPTTPTDANHQGIRS